MSIYIDREDLFKEKLLTGINLFTGAGFSCLENNDGIALPVVNKLCEEICKKFSLDYDVFGDDLEAICALADDSELQSYLRKRFKLSNVNEKYFVLNRIKLLSYITTNIDNIIHLIVEHDTRYYLKSITYYGGIRKSEIELCYIPLHGEVMNEENKLYFGKFDLAAVDQANSDLFQEATVKMRNKPVLFWGYGFHDSGVLKTVKKLLSYGSQDIWIQCMPDDEKRIRLFKELGCNIIKANTEELLDWMHDNVQIFDNKNITEQQSIIENNKNLSDFFIPSLGQVPAVQATDYYIKGFTQWYSILAKQAIELDIVNNVYNTHIQNKNIIIIGTDFSGKSTALMQLALKINAPNKLYVTNLTMEKSQFIINNIGEAKVLIFVDNCENDIKAYKMLAECSNISTIATATDYAYEASKHLLEGVLIKNLFIEDFTQDQARRFYNSLDETIRKSVFVYKDSENEKFSILEMMLKNIANSMGSYRIRQLLLKILYQNQDAFETVALACYLSGNHSALSTDILFSYFDCTSYDETKKYVNEANGLLRELDVSVDQCDDDQDYYDVRSKLFLYHCKKLLSETKELQKPYAKTIEKFIRKISIYKIYQYNLFRRSAYDAKLYFTLFNNKANEIYSYLYDYEPNPYTLQQWALCMAYLKQFKEAFSYIDKAMRQKPNNFSIENTSAIILFEANKEEKNSIGREKRQEAMKILEKCYHNDKRKVYHANRFAEFAIEIAQIDNDYEYLHQAKLWLDEIMTSGNAISRFTKKHYKKITELIKLYNLETV